jgi:DNA-binding transcriptional ArsR family regulator
VLRSAQLDATAKVAYALLRDYARQERSAFPGMLTLAARVPTTRRSLYYYLRKLTDAGLVTIEHRGLGKTNRYWIEPLSAATLARLLPACPHSAGGDDLEHFFDDEPAPPSGAVLHRPAAERLPE